MPESYCRECGEPVVPDDSPGVWVHDPDELGDEAYELNEQHSAVPSVCQICGRVLWNDQTVTDGPDGPIHLDCEPVEED